MFKSLEDIKAYCEKEYPNKPPLVVVESVFSEGKPKWYFLRINFRPYQQEHIDTLIAKLKSLEEEIKKCGFTASTTFASVSDGGYYLGLSVK